MRRRLNARLERRIGMTRELEPWAISLIVLIVWMIIILGGVILQAGRTSLQDLVSKHIVYSFVAAPIFLLAVVAYTEWWRQVGLQPDGSINNLKVLAMPALALVVIWAVAFSRGLPGGTTLTLIGANTLLVGFSEELMFRGILFYGSKMSFGFMGAVVVTSVLFGLMHDMNSLITGNKKQAIFQAFFTTVFGFWIVALRAYLNTIIPLVVIHWLWDFGLFAAAPVKAASVDAAPTRSMLLLAVEIALFGYGFWLLLT